MSFEAVKTAGRALPSDLSQILTVAQVELKRNLRRKRLLALVIVVVFVSAVVIVIFPALGFSYPSDPILGPYTFGAIFLQFVGFLAVLLAVFFGGDPLVSEFHARTGYSLFPNPVKRSSIFLGKVLASLVASWGVIALLYAIDAGSLAAIYGRVPVELLYSFSFSILYIAAVVAVAYLVSALAKTTTAALVLTFVLFFFLFNTLSSVMMFAGVRPDAFLTFQGGIVTTIMTGPFPESYPQDYSYPGISFTFYQPRIEIAIPVILIWMAVCFFLAYLVFRRREMLG